MRWLVRILIAVFVILVAGGVALWLWKPWVPPVQMAEPGASGSRIEESGLIANFFPGPDPSGNPAVLLLGGSEGGLGHGARNMAAALQEEGFAVLQLAYYRAPGQQENLELVPLERIERGLDWLAANPNADASRLGLMGVSKGAEAGLIVAARRPELDAVVLGVPSSVAWTGINWNFGGAGRKPSWTRDGEPVPALPYGRYDWESGVYSVYEGGLAAVDDHPDAVIPVEAVEAPMLLICGEADSLWPSCPMARQIEARAAERAGPTVTLLAYPEAGHFSIGLPVAEDHPGYERLAEFGGDPAGNAAARADGWPRIVAFFESRLEAESAPGGGSASGG